MAELDAGAEGGAVSTSLFGDRDDGANVDLDVGAETLADADGDVGSGHFAAWDVDLGLQRGSRVDNRIAMNEDTSNQNPKRPTGAQE